MTLERYTHDSVIGFGRRLVRANGAKVFETFKGKRSNLRVHRFSGSRGIVFALSHRFKVRDFCIHLIFGNQVGCLRWKIGPVHGISLLLDTSVVYMDFKGYADEQRFHFGLLPKRIPGKTITYMWGRFWNSTAKEIA